MAEAMDVSGLQASLQDYSLLDTRDVRGLRQEASESNLFRWEGRRFVFVPVNERDGKGVCIAVPGARRVEHSWNDVVRSELQVLDALTREPLSMERLRRLTCLPVVPRERGPYRTNENKLD